MSEPDDIDAQQDAWDQKQEQIRALHMTAHPDCRDPAHPGCSQCRSYGSDTNDYADAMVVEGERLAQEADALQTAAYAEGRRDEREAHASLRLAAEQILNAGHMNTEDLALLRAAWEAV